MTAPEIVQAGKKAGVSFSASLVYAVRSRQRRSPSSKREGRVAAPVSTRGDGGARLDAEVRRLVDGFVKEVSELVRRSALDAVRAALGERRR
jgi:hypothetical protein